MAHGLKVVFLGLCVTFVIMPRADAQETSHMAQMKQLRQEMRELQQKLIPLNQLIQQHMAEIKALREQMGPMQEKLVDDLNQMKYLQENQQ